MKITIKIKKNTKTTHSFPLDSNKFELFNTRKIYNAPNWGLPYNYIIEIGRVSDKYLMTFGDVKSYTELVADTFKYNLRIETVLYKKRVIINPFKEGLIIKLFKEDEDELVLDCTFKIVK